MVSQTQTTAAVWNKYFYFQESWPIKQKDISSGNWETQGIPSETIVNLRATLDGGGTGTSGYRRVVPPCAGVCFVIGQFCNTIGSCTRLLVDTTGLGDLGARAIVPLTLLDTG